MQNSKITITVVVCVSLNLLLITKLTNGSQFIDDFVNNELYLGSEEMYANTTIADCVWHNIDDQCSGDVSIILYADRRRQVFDPRDKYWLQNSVYNPRKKNVVLVHGYASGDQDPPFTVLRRAYERTGRYNVFLVDYSSLARPPCYVSAVNNIRYISRCIAEYLNEFHTDGLYVDKLTCTGHSLGAIVCGQLRNNLQFQLNKIIALDPAWPLILGDLRLEKSSARLVHVLQTNAGHFGSIGSIGHVNVCVNSGYIQPYCFGTRNPHLCSHIYSMCYMAQSLFHKKPLIAKKCFTFCPNLGLFKFMIKEEIKVINNVPPTASGTYCIENRNPPYCPEYLNGFGDELCCQVL